MENFYYANLCNEISSEKICNKSSLYFNIKYNECVDECSGNDFFNGICKLNPNNVNSYSKDKMIENIKTQIINGEMDLLIMNILEEKKKLYNRR